MTYANLYVSAISKVSVRPKPVCKDRTNVSNSLDTSRLSICLNIQMESRMVDTSWVKFPAMALWPVFLVSCWSSLHFIWSRYTAYCKRPRASSASVVVGFYNIQSYYISKHTLPCWFITGASPLCYVTLESPKCRCIARNVFPLKITTECRDVANVVCFSVFLYSYFFCYMFEWRL